MQRKENPDRKNSDFFTLKSIVILFFFCIFANDFGCQFRETFWNRKIKKLSKTDNLLKTKNLKNND